MAVPHQTMNRRPILLFTAAVTLSLPSCGFVNKTIGTVSNAAGGLLNTVTSPLRGITGAAGTSGSENAWRSSLDHLPAEAPAPPHDRQRTETKRRH